MKKRIGMILAVIAALACSVFATACGEVEFKVNFVVDGAVYETIDTSGDETIKMPNDPTKDGYEFGGWFWDEGVWEKPFTANSLLDAPLSSDMKVYAKWNPSNQSEPTDPSEPTEPIEPTAAEYFTVSESGDAVTGLKGDYPAKIVIPSSINGVTITSIGDSAFADCTELTSVIVPDGVTSIGDCAFGGCNSLQYNEYDNAYYLGNSNNQYLLLVKAKSTDITSCQINENCKFIHSSAFGGCSGLTSVTIPDKVTSIGDFAFIGCNSLQYNEYDNAYYLGNSNNKHLLLVKAKSTGITTCQINENCKFIHSSAFSGCSGLTSVTIGGSVTSIGQYAFSGCSGLTSVYYKGTKSEWNNITILSYNSSLTSATRYYYSETEPTTTGNYWRYVDGEVVVW